MYVADDKAEAEAALKRAAAATQRTVDVSRTPGQAVAGSHVLSYAGTAGATEAHTLYDTPDGIAEKLDALSKAGVAYVLLTTLGGPAQLRRFAREVAPAALQKSALPGVARNPHPDYV
jgi:alkanesulfonate monooxygenase SsuD/methylene tetrahydromethanopterin reductase-like flavin-dependent oxidoreductase (luciferase family)